VKFIYDLTVLKRKVSRVDEFARAFTKLFLEIGITAGAPGELGTPLNELYSL
jgi:hypothetical protein